MNIETKNLIEEFISEEITVSRLSTLYEHYVRNGTFKNNDSAFREWEKIEIINSLCLSEGRQPTLQEKLDVIKSMELIGTWLS